MRRSAALAGLEQQPAEGAEVRGRELERLEQQPDRGLAIARRDREVGEIVKIEHFAAATQHGRGPGGVARQRERDRPSALRFAGTGVWRRVGDDGDEELDGDRPRPSPAPASSTDSPPAMNRTAARRRNGT